METLNIALIAAGLAMDAFAVAVVVSLELQRISLRQFFRLSFHFGFFQLMMPVLGWSLGAWAEHWVQAVDHWIVFGLLGFIGGKMIIEAGGGRMSLKGRDPTRGLDLVLLCVATSLDALGVGFSLPFLSSSIWLPCIVIGITASLFTIAGMQFGKLLKPGTTARLEKAGGLVLIGIGVKILLEHTVCM